MNRPKKFPGRPQIDLPRAIVVMGVSGSGKSLVGSSLAQQLGRVFIEGDRLHPPENVTRMTSGQPLTDELRAGWLDAIGSAVQQNLRGGLDVVASCSALKRSYRDRLRGFVPDIVFIHLMVDHETAWQRVSRRRAHFMPASLVDSQFADLQPPDADERHVAIDATQPVAKLVDMIIAQAAAPLFR